MTIQGARPHVRVTLCNVRTMEEQPALANPTELETTIEVGWNKLAVPGLSHEVMQYKNTGNVGFPLTIECSEFDYSAEVMDDFERFLESACYADYQPNGILEAAPPRLLIVWPKVLSMLIVVESLSIKRTQFAAEDGRTLRYTASIKVTEIRDARITAADVRAQGLRRSAASPPKGPASGGTGSGGASGST